ERRLARGRQLRVAVAVVLDLDRRGVAGDRRDDQLLVALQRLQEADVFIDREQRVAGRARLAVGLGAEPDQIRLIAGDAELGALEQRATDRQVRVPDRALRRRAVVL